MEISPEKTGYAIMETNIAVTTSLQRNKLLREKEVKDLTKIGKTKRNALIKAGLFPKPVKIFNEYQLPGRTNYWTQGEILDFLQFQIDARNNQLAQIATDGLNGWLNRDRQLAREASHG